MVKGKYKATSSTLTSRSSLTNAVNCRAVVLARTNTIVFLWKYRLAPTRPRIIFLANSFVHFVSPRGESSQQPPIRGLVQIRSEIARAYQEILPAPPRLSTHLEFQSSYTRLGTPVGLTIQGRDSSQTLCHVQLHNTREVAGVHGSRPQP